MSTGSFVDETFDADLICADLGPTREANAVSFGLPPTNLFRVIIDFVGRSVVAVGFDGRRLWWDCVALGHADDNRAVGAATRLFLFVCSGLGFSFTLRFLQPATFAQWGTRYAAAVFADAVAFVGELLLFRFGQFRLGRFNPIS